MAAAHGQDVVFLRGLAMTAVIGPDTWHRSNKSQPAIVDLRVRTNIELAANTDDVLETIHYGNLCKRVTEGVETSSPFIDISHFAEFVGLKALNGGDHIVEVTVVLPKALLLADGLGYSTIIGGSSLEEPKGLDQKPFAFIRDMRLACIIGVNPHERLEKQQVFINLKLFDFDGDFWADYAKVIKAVTDGVEQSSYETLEALATFIGKIICTNSSVKRLTISVQKPSALMFVGGSGVEITRDRKFYSI